MKKRTKINFFINQQLHEVDGEKIFLSLSDYLRLENRLVGTKVVCAEGDCGACTVLVASAHDLKKNKFQFKSVNSCILPLFSLDGAQVVTIEGLSEDKRLNPIKKAMSDNFASQCGFCTPGFVCAMTAMTEKCVQEDKQITAKKAQNYLTGNLCRCTGYDFIVKSALDIDLAKVEPLYLKYHDNKKINFLKKQIAMPLEIKIDGDRSLFLPTTLKQAILYKEKNKFSQIVAGSTDLGVLVNKGKYSYQKMISLQNISELRKLTLTSKGLYIGARVTIHQFQKFFEKKYGENHEVVRLLNIFASPQIKNIATLVGNILNASPVSDTAPFLMAYDAEVCLSSAKKDKKIKLAHFYLDYKKMDKTEKDIISGIFIPAKNLKNYLKCYKVSLRKDLDISAVTLAVSFQIKQRKIIDPKIVFGGVGPTVKRFGDLEKKWQNQLFTEENIVSIAEFIPTQMTPITDVRGSENYRRIVSQRLIYKLVEDIKSEGLFL